MKFRISLSTSKGEALKRALTGPAAKLWDQLVEIYNKAPGYVGRGTHDEITTRRSKYFMAKKQEIADLYTRLQPYTKDAAADKDLASKHWLKVFLLTPTDIKRSRDLLKIFWNIDSYSRAYRHFKKQYVPSGSMSKEAYAWLSEWKKDNGYKGMPPEAVVNELRNYVSAEPVKLYRGIRFGKKIKRAKVGQPVTFKDSVLSSWSHNKDWAERFARYQPSGDSWGTGMLMWFEQMKAKKTFQGEGGFVAEAMVDPSAQLVDITKVPKFFNQHGAEGEVVILPGKTITAKVIKIIR